MKRRLGWLLTLALSTAWLSFAAVPSHTAWAAGRMHTVANQAQWDALAGRIAAEDTVLLTGAVVHAAQPLACRQVTIAQGGSLTVRQQITADVTVEDGGRYVLDSGQQQHGHLTQTGGESALHGAVNGTVQVQGGTLTFYGGAGDLPGEFRLGGSDGATLRNAGSAGAIGVLTLQGQPRDDLAAGHAFAMLPAPQNPRWDGATVRWEAVAHATSYQFQVYVQGQTAQPLSHTAQQTSFDCAGELQPYAPGTFTFEVAALGGTVGDTTYLRSDWSAMSAPLMYPQPIAFAQQPAAQQVAAGGSAQFAVQVTGDSPTYRWQVKAAGQTAFADLPGADGATLQLSGVTRDMHGNQYRCVVRNAQGELASQPAALSVYATADASSIAVEGLQPGQAIAAGAQASFAVRGANMALSEPHPGDERLRPTAYRVFAYRADGQYALAAPLAQGALSTPGYGATLQTQDWEVGEYVLFLSCVLERYENGQWTDVGQTLPAHEALQFALVPAESLPAATPGGAVPTPSPAASPDGATLSTGERGVPAAVPIALIVLAAGIAAAVWIGRRRAR